MTDKQFAKMVNGKSIALVGPSNSIVDSKNGAHIDNHDLVIRMNNCLPLPNGLSEDIGIRTDILYHGLYGIYHPDYLLDIDMCVKAGVQCMVATCTIDKYTKDSVDYYHEQNKNRIPLRTIDSYIRPLSKQIQTKPNTGLISLFDLIRFDIKEIFVTGIDFYKSYYHDGYNIKTRTDGSLNKHHNLMSHKKHLADLVNSDHRIKIDKVLQDIFKEEGLI